MHQYVTLLPLLVSPVEPAILTRIEETFKRMSTATGHIPQATFTRDILGDGVPAKLAEVYTVATYGPWKSGHYKEVAFL